MAKIEPKCEYKAFKMLDHNFVLRTKDDPPVTNEMVASFYETFNAGNLELLRNRA